MAKISGNEPFDYEKFISETFDGESAKAAEKTVERTADDIISDLMPLVEADRKKAKS